MFYGVFVESYLEVPPGSVLWILVELEAWLLPAVVVVPPSRKSASATDEPMVLLIGGIVWFGGRAELWVGES